MWSIDSDTMTGDGENDIIRYQTSMGKFPCPKYVFASPKSDEACGSFN